MKTQKPKNCPICESEKIVKHGFKITRGYGKRQRFQCQECASTFYGEDVV